MLIIGQVLREKWFENDGFCSFTNNKQTSITKPYVFWFQYLNTIFLYFNPSIWQKDLNFHPWLKYILSVVKLYFIKRKTSLINLQCILFNKYD